MTVCSENEEAVRPYAFLLVNSSQKFIIICFACKKHIISVYITHIAFFRMISLHFSSFLSFTVHFTAYREIPEWHLLCYDSEYSIHQQMSHKNATCFFSWQKDRLQTVLLCLLQPVRVISLSFFCFVMFGCFAHHIRLPPADRQCRSDRKSVV